MKAVPGARRNTRTSAEGEAILKRASLQPMPAWIEPMKATLTESRFSRKDWLFEPKLDGVRCLAFGRKGKVQLFSRNKLGMNDTYPEIVDSLKTQPLKNFILDGEVVAFRPNSTVTSFGTLQQRIGIHDAAEARRSPIPVFYYVFDVLYAQGRDLRSLSLIQRKAVLESSFNFDPSFRFTSHILDRGEAYYAEACRQGWEGLIAKRLESRYISGRSHDWLKFKCLQEQEFVVGGYSEPEGARSHFGALLLGYYDHGELRFAGKVGTGFDYATLTSIMERLTPLSQPTSPFKRIDIPRRGLHWVKPALVAQIVFGEWTEDGKLRQPRFIGLRNDKKPSDVIREKPIPSGGHHGKKKSST